MLYYISTHTLKTLAIKCKTLIIKLAIWEKWRYKNVEKKSPTSMTEGLYSKGQEARGHQTEVGTS